MKKETFIVMLFCGVMACGWVFGDSLSGNAKGGFCGMALAFISMFIGVVMWGIWIYEASHRMNWSRDREVMAQVAQAMETQKKADQKVMLAFGEALARKCVVRMIAIMAPEGGRAHLLEQTEALVEEEVEAVREGSKA